MGDTTLSHPFSLSLCLLCSLCHETLLVSMYSGRLWRFTWCASYAVILLHNWLQSNDTLPNLDCFRFRLRISLYVCGRRDWEYRVLSIQLWKKWKKKNKPKMIRWIEPKNRPNELRLKLREFPSYTHQSVNLFVASILRFCDARFYQQFLALDLNNEHTKPQFRCTSLLVFIRCALLISVSVAAASTSSSSSFYFFLICAHTFRFFVASHAVNIVACSKIKRRIAIRLLLFLLYVCFSFSFTTNILRESFAFSDNWRLVSGQQIVQESAKNLYTFSLHRRSFVPTMYF